MLELKDIRKRYETKSGEHVDALDGVSLKFPNKGMVFLLGKSGSGKSTMLNVIGGLDKMDSGEIIIKGKSSNDFTNSDFDSYRNTFVGFIFQEYNILEDFTIEENISLALQLQSKPSNKETVNELLNLVGLEGLGDRKPNTLSGGQRQRVAIARALIKDPEIIMADEPTGALDSKTGAQILEILKKLSENQLVIVVSHDREFAEKYGDRIIEIADGKVISDKTKVASGEHGFIENVVIHEGTISIKDGKKLTDEDAQKIISAIRSSDNGSVIALEEKEINQVKKVCKIKENGVKEIFDKTDENAIEEYKGEKPSLIKSRLPLKHCLKLGISGLKIKPIRFIFTVFLSVISFCIFGVLSSLMLYDQYYSLSKSLTENGYQSVLISKNYDVTSNLVTVHDSDTIVLERSEKLVKPTLFGEQEKNLLNQNSLGINYAGVFNFSSAYEYRDDARIYLNYNIAPNYSGYFAVKYFNGFSDVGEQYLIDNNIEYFGRYPENENEIMISEYIFELYKYSTHNKDENLTIESFLSKNSTIALDSEIIGKLAPTVVGVFKGSNLESYEVVKDYSNSSLPMSEKDQLIENLSKIVSNSLDTVAFVSPSFYDAYKGYIYETKPKLSSIKGKNIVIEYDSKPHVSISVGTEKFLPLSLIQYQTKYFTLHNFDGSIREYSLNDDEIIVNETTFINLLLVEEYNVDVKNKEERDIALTKLNELKNSNPEGYNALVGKVTDNSYNSLNTIDKTRKTLKFVGYYTHSAELGGDLPYIVTDKFMHENSTIDIYTETRNETSYVPPEDIRYNYLVTKSDNSIEQVRFMLDSDETYNYSMVNDTYNKLFNGGIVSTIALLKQIFLIAGVIVGIFAALMLLNFISTSITAKRKEIGILRAVGAGRDDVFKIFFTESLILTIICFILASILSFIGCFILNGELFKLFGVDLLVFNIINILMIFIITIVISFASTIVPVIMEAKKSPVEGIRQI